MPSTVLVTQQAFNKWQIFLVFIFLALNMGALYLYESKL